MKPTHDLRGRLGALLLRRTAARAGGLHADWLQAMCAEADQCADSGERLVWAAGCWSAGLSLALREAQAYLAALAIGVALMVAYEWRCDEGLATVAIIAALSLALGLIRPASAWLSGGLIGLVVAAVLAFEALSGLRPAYEHHGQTLAHALRWLVLLAPALTAAALGGRVGRFIHLKAEA